MTLLEDLGLLEYGSKGKRMTYGIYECPVCHNGFKCATSRVKNGTIKQCRSCADKAKMQKAREEFAEKANKTHCTKYDYSLVGYINAITKVEIVCPIHGSFWQTPQNHLKGTDCPECSKNQTAFSLSTDARNKFKEKADALHKEKYNYDLVNYVNNRIKVTIICSIHGEFEQSPSNHLQGHGCPSCAKRAYKIGR